MADAQSKTLWGAQALVALVVAVIWVAAGALCWQRFGSPLGAVLFALGCLFGVGTAAVGLRSRVVVNEEGVVVAGRTITWAEVVEVRVTTAKGVDPAFPVLHVRRGRGIAPVDLDGLGQYGAAARMHGQAALIAERAGLDGVSTDADESAPGVARRGRP